jgi:hypothetical protein
MVLLTSASDLKFAMPPVAGAPEHEPVQAVLPLTVVLTAVNVPTFEKMPPVVPAVHEPTQPTFPLTVLSKIVAELRVSTPPHLRLRRDCRNLCFHSQCCC